MGSASADPGEEEESDLELQAKEHQDLNGPAVPEMSQRSSHCCSFLSVVRTARRTKPTCFIQEM
jgi:hypothetical protein